MATTISSAAAIDTPIRDLSTDPISDSHCDRPTFQEDDDLDGVMVLYRGNKLAEWRNPDSQSTDWLQLNYVEGTTQHAQFAVTKTWISVLIGMLYRDGFLDWETEHPDKITLGDIFPDQIWDDIWDIPFLIHGGSKVPELKRIKLGEIMSMRTGYSENGISSPFDSTLVRDLDRLVAWWHPLYRSEVIDSQTCFDCGSYLGSSGIVNYVIKEKTKTASNPDGWDPLDYAQQTSATLPNRNIGLFEALGMEEGSYKWDRDRDGVARGSFGLWADLEDMAKFGQLLLQGGLTIFNGVERVVIPRSYFEEMTTTQSRIIGVDLPYGWQVWNWGADDNGDSGFCAEGLGWQSICVFPNQETVVAIQSPVSFGVETFAANIGFRNEEVKAIRDGIQCSPTAAPTSSLRPPSNPSPPTPPPTGENMIGANPQDPIDGGNVNSGKDDEVINGESESEIFVGATNANDDGAPVGLIILFVLLSIFVCVMLTLFFRAKRKNETTGAGSRSSTEAMFKVTPEGYDDEFNKVYDVALDDEDSVNTEESDGVTFIVAEDSEGRLSSP